MTKAKTRAPVGKIAATQNTVKPSKYRVEAEKNLDRVLPASPSNNTILIVDDADDLFGKRSPTKPQ
ncbi:MAG: hypothetical protein HGA71_09395 [Azonexaceae bacterium]|nr:hypothetical protein [Azonexaceae bacterium]